jgi:hypothetical protein
MAINDERFVKLKRFEADFTFDDTVDQVLLNPTRVAQSLIDGGVIGGVPFPSGTTTLNVPGAFATIQSAIDYVNDRRIPFDAAVVIQLANGTYDMANTTLTLHHPDGDRCSIIGNLASPSSCILRWTGTAAAAAAIYATNGYRWGLIDGVEIQSGTSVTGRVAERAGVLAENGASIRLGAACRVRRFWFNVFARNAGRIRCSGTSGASRVEVSEGGDSNICALLGGFIDARWAYSWGATAVPDGDIRWGCGILAESGGVVWADDAVAEGCNLAGIAAYANGVVRAPRASANDGVGNGSTNIGSGFVARFGGMIDCGDGTATDNAGYAFDRDALSTIARYGTMTVSGNVTGVERTLAVLSDAGATISPEGDAADLDMNIGGKGTGSFRALSRGLLALYATANASAVNYLGVRAVATGGAPTIEAAGSDADVSVAISAKNAGTVNLRSRGATVLSALANSSPDTFLYARSTATGSNPSIEAAGTATDIGLDLWSKGAGAVSHRTGNGIAFASLANASANSYILARARSSDRPQFEVVSSLSDCDLGLAPKGTGVVRFGTFTSNADAAVDGYITIKDSAGNSRKLATIA